MEHRFINDHFDQQFTDTFKKYFKELGINVNNWNGIFTEMNDCIGKYNMKTLVILFNGKTIGFIQFQKDELLNWFFKEQIGFIREFYIDSQYRGKGYGSRLIELALKWFKDEGIKKVLLTSDTADAFYIKLGFKHDEAYLANNALRTYVIEL